jgi:hypothetical protein
MFIQVSLSCSLCLAFSIISVAASKVLIDLELDVNPNNIFLSDLEAPVPTVKLGDLDNGMQWAYFRLEIN